MSKPYEKGFFEQNILMKELNIDSRFQDLLGIM